MNTKSKGPTEIRQRLIRGFSAAALEPLVTLLVQLGTVPLLLHGWGAAKYGDWLILSAIPSYLSMSDLGFGDASGSDMTARVAGGSRQEALNTFQSSWALLTAVSVLLLMVSCGLVSHIPWQHWLHLSSLSDAQAAWIVLILAGYVLVGQQIGVLESGFRCDGHFAFGASFASLVRLSEAVAGTIAGLATGYLAVVALTYLLVRMSGTLAYAAILRHKSPWLQMGVRHAKLDRIRELAAPAAGFVALPLGNALSVQGLTLVIGSVLGPVAVTAFSTMRTLSRLNFQALGIVARGMWPELSAAFGRGDLALARRLHRRAYQFGLASSLAGVGLLWLLGPLVYHAWIRNAVSLDSTCFHVLLAVCLANSLWYISSVVPMSANAHSGMALAYLITAAASAALSWVLVHPLGLTGAALALLSIDLVMCGLVLGISLRQLDDSFARFFASVWKFRFSVTALQEAE